MKVVVYEGKFIRCHIALLVLEMALHTLGSRHTKLPDGVADARILQGLRGRLDKYLKVISTWGLQKRQAAIGSGNLLS